MIAALALLLGAGVAAAQPLVTLEQHDMPGGGRRTLFVLYDDGRVIWSTRKRPTEMGAGYATALLSDEERRAFLAALPDEATWAALPPNSDAAPNTFDGVWQQICRFRDGARRCVGVRGVLDERGPRADRTRAAPAFVAAYDRLIGFRRADARSWAPERVEVRLHRAWRRTGAVPWPRAWDAPLVPCPPEARRELPCWTTTIPGPELRRLQVVADDHRAFLVGGEPRLAAYEVSLPGEDLWRAR